MSLVRPVPISVLDGAPVAEGSTPSDALRNSIDVAKRVEDWGYRRLWVTEHHSMPGVAASAPAVLLSYLASVTDRIRLGSGGVMLPNHAPLVVAEQFGTLEAFAPGRIDLGLGRAPGADQRTAQALRRNAAGTDEEFVTTLLELQAFFQGSFPEGHPYHNVQAVPGEGNVPEVPGSSAPVVTAPRSPALWVGRSYSHITSRRPIPCHPSSSIGRVFVPRPGSGNRTS